MPAALQLPKLLRTLTTIAPLALLMVAKNAARWLVPCMAAATAVAGGEGWQPFVAKERACTAGLVGRMLLAVGFGHCTGLHFFRLYRKFWLYRKFMNGL